MRSIIIDSLTLLVGGNRLEREQQMGEFQSASDFMTAIIQDIREDDNGAFLMRLHTVPCFALSEVQSIGGKPATEQLLSDLLMDRQRRGLLTVLGNVRYLRMFSKIPDNAGNHRVRGERHALCAGRRAGPGAGRVGCLCLDTMEEFYV